jgi:hypothetical protein
VAKSFVGSLRRLQRRYRRDKKVVDCLLCVFRAPTLALLAACVVGYMLYFYKKRFKSLLERAEDRPHLQKKKLF